MFKELKTKELKVELVKAGIDKSKIDEALIKSTKEINEQLKNRVK